MWDGPQNPVDHLPKYRIMLITEAGAVAGSFGMAAVDDDEAMGMASDVSDIHAVELWEGLRFIEHFRAQAPV